MNLPRGSRQLPKQAVAEMTFGIITPRQRPEDLKELRESAIDEMAENAASEGREANPPSS
jgi:hypothetical protein